jgi:hypothetical protein
MGSADQVTGTARFGSEGCLKHFKGV